MRNRIIQLASAAILCASFGFVHADDLPILTGPYLGQKLPGMTPEVFALGIISQGYHELSLTISPNGKEAFYVTSDRSWNYIIIHLTQDNDIWAEPEVASFSGNHQDVSPCFSPDGKRLYFCSMRPVSGDSPPEEDFDIWIVEKTENSWSEPHKIGSPINDKKDVWDVAVSGDGTIYFSAEHKEETTSDLYVSRLENGRYTMPEKLGGEINTDYNESGPHISPGKNYLLFQSTRPGGFGGNDLYVCFIQADGSWSEPVNLGATVNSPSHDFRPRVSPDGRYLFFSSGRPFETDSIKGTSYRELMELYRHPQNGYGTLFWMDAKIIKELK